MEKLLTLSLSCARARALSLSLFLSRSSPPPSLSLSLPLQLGEKRLGLGGHVTVLGSYKLASRDLLQPLL
jgi:hypothetical protein